MAVYQAFNAVAAAVTGTGRPAGPPHWQSELFGIADDTNVCLQSCCCIWCTESAVVLMRETGQPDQLDPFLCCSFLFCEVVTRPFFSTSLILGLRRELVQRYGIQDEPYCTSILHNYCAPCSFCQIQREMAKRGEHPGGLLAKPPSDGVAGAMGKAVGAAAAMGGQALNIAPWGSTLFNCTGAEECVDSTCLACCSLAHVANRIDAGRVQLIPKDSENKMDPLTCVGAACCFVPFNYATRREVIGRYQLTEPTLHSYCFSLFCAPCSLAQVKREMGYRGEWPSGLVMKVAPHRPLQ